MATIRGELRVPKGVCEAIAQERLRFFNCLIRLTRHLDDNLRGNSVNFSLTLFSNVSIDWELVAEGFDFCFDFGFDLGVALFAVLGQSVDHFDDPVCDLAEFIFAKATGGTRG